MAVDTRVQVGTAARARVVAGVLAVAAVAAAVNLLARPLAAADFDSYAAVRSSRDAVWLFALVGGVSSGVAFVCLGLAVCALVASRGAAWATLGTVLLGVGGVCFAAGFFAVGASGWYLTADGAETLFTYGQDHAVRAFGVQATGFVAVFLGLVMSAVGLWRARSVPRWLAVALPGVFVGMVLSGSGVVYDVVHAGFMSTLVMLSWYVWRLAGAGEA
ncbi:hypothetical protein OG216_36015 [Streptomycetaceae bacterium NBC_01309]